jgi:hypothetical protein
MLSRYVVDQSNKIVPRLVVRPVPMVIKEGRSRKRRQSRKGKERI